MKEGYWVTLSGRAEFVQEHCNAMQNPDFARKIGLPDSVFEIIKEIPNDYQGPKRQQILRLVIDAGFIRLRGHGQWIAIEFTVSTEAALRACRKLLDQVCGPFTVLRFNNLQTSETAEMTYQEFEQRMKKQDHPQESGGSL